MWNWGRRLRAGARAGVRSSREMRCVACCVLRWANYMNPLPPSAKKKSKKSNTTRKTQDEREIESQSGGFRSLRTSCLQACWPHDWAWADLSPLVASVTGGRGREPTKDGEGGSGEMSVDSSACLRRLPPFLLFSLLHPEGLPEIFPYRQP